MMFKRGDVVYRYQYIYINNRNYPYEVVADTVDSEYYGATPRLYKMENGVLVRETEMFITEREAVLRLKKMMKDDKDVQLMCDLIQSRKELLNDEEKICD